MITSMEIPHLAEGQTISNYRKIFIASTATLNAKQQLGCFPLYIHRTEGERQLAFTAATKASQDEAFKFLEDMIDEVPVCLRKVLILQHASYKYHNRWIALILF